jgi:hypothetical protein
MKFYLTFCKTRKKFDKYIKINRVRNKSIIDIRAIIDEEKIDLTNPDSVYYFKVLVYKKIQTSIEKNKDIYYVPNFWSKNFEILHLLKLKDLLAETDDFNLLLFHNEFNQQPDWMNFLFSNLSTFTTSQILKDY